MAARFGLNVRATTIILHLLKLSVREPRRKSGGPVYDPWLARTRNIVGQVTFGVVPRDYASVVVNNFRIWGY